MKTAELSNGDMPEKEVEKLAKGDKIMITVLLLSTMIMWTLYGNITTFYPPYVKDNHKTMNSTMVGVVLAMFEVGVLIFSPVVSLLL
jgi:hypothetical protein